MARTHSGLAGRLTTDADEGHADWMPAPAATIDPNPYAPPLADPAAEWPILPIERWDELRLAAKLVSQRTMERVVRIAGSLEAEIYYDARMIGEQVYVNGRLRGQSSVWHWTLVAPEVEFLVEGNQFRVPALVEVKVGPSWRTVVRLSRFRLWVAGRVLYEE
jgi:hypothetical protein